MHFPKSAFLECKNCPEFRDPFAFLGRGSINPVPFQALIFNGEHMDLRLNQTSESS